MPHVTFGQLSDSRRNNLDFLRFFFASLVIFSHSWPLLTGAEDPLSALSHGRQDLGALSVAAFFAISGMLIAKSYLYSRSLADFLRKRALRIYPGWTVALLFCLFVVPPLSRPDHHLHFSPMAALLLFEPLVLHSGSSALPGTFPTSPYPFAGVVIGSTWSIPYEIMCYLLVALIGVLGILRRRPLVTALFVAAVAFYFWPGRPQVLSLRYFADLSWLPTGVTYFLTGTLFYVWRDAIPYSRRLCALAAVALGAGLVLPVVPGFQAILLLCGGYVLFFAAFRPTRRLHDFGKRGDFSYGLYLYAFPIQQLLVQYLGPHLTPVTLSLLAWPVTLGLAVLSWRLVEEPFLRLKPRPQVAPAAVPADAALHAPAAPAPAPRPQPSP